MKELSSPEKKTFGDWAYLAIAKHFRKMSKHEAGVLADQDPEELHEMRIGMRRLRSAISDFAPAIDLPKGAGERNIASIARNLGKLRDIDVLQETLKKGYYSDLPKSERKYLDKISQKLAKQRHKAFKEAKGTLKGRKYQKLQKSFQAWLKEPQYQAIASVEVEQVLPDLLLPQISELLLDPAWLVGVKVEGREVVFLKKLDRKQVVETLATQEEKLHKLRKKAKKTRYQMDLFTQFYDHKYQDHLKQVKEIQKVLGDLQDSFVLKAFLNGFCKNKLEKYLPTLEALLEDKRYQKWQEWQECQGYFLNFENRKDWRLVICSDKVSRRNPIPKVVISQELDTLVEVDGEVQ